MRDGIKCLDFPIFVGIMLTYDSFIAYCNGVCTVLPPQQDFELWGIFLWGEGALREMGKLSAKSRQAPTRKQCRSGQTFKRHPTLKIARKSPWSLTISCRDAPNTLRSPIGPESLPLALYGRRSWHSSWALSLLSLHSAGTFGSATSWASSLPLRMVRYVP